MGNLKTQNITKEELNVHLSKVLTAIRVYCKTDCETLKEHKTVPMACPGCPLHPFSINP